MILNGPLPPLLEVQSPPPSISTPRKQQRRRLFLLTPLPLQALRDGGNDSGNGILLARGAMQLPLVAHDNRTGASWEMG